MDVKRPKAARAAKPKAARVATGPTPANIQHVRDILGRLHEDIQCAGAHGQAARWLDMVMTAERELAD